jgi:hypothetical protein
MLFQYRMEEYASVSTSSHEKGDLPNIADLNEFYKSAKQRLV